MSTITLYGLLSNSEIIEYSDPTELDNYLVYKTLEEASATMSGSPSFPGPVVTITIETPEPTLPTTLGSVIQADVYDDDDQQATLALDGDGDWVTLEGWHQGEVIDVEDMKNMKVLFDAATVKEG